MAVIWYTETLQRPIKIFTFASCLDASSSCLRDLTSFLNLGPGFSVRGNGVGLSSWQLVPDLHIIHLQFWNPASGSNMCSLPMIRAKHTRQSGSQWLVSKRAAAVGICRRAAELLLEAIAVGFFSSRCSGRVCRGSSGGI